MRIAVFCSEPDKVQLAALLDQLRDLTQRLPKYVYCHDQDQFMQSLVEENTDLVLVTAPGAAGMEAVYAAKNTYPASPVIWFSDDKDFGAQSYRLGCAYFSARPVTRDLLERSLRCASVT